jgi:hypothetical protein
METDMKAKTLVLALGVLAAGSGTAFASDYCTMAPSNEWRSQDDAKAAAIALGYDVANIKVEDNCYEVYARKDGKKLEVFIDPVKLTVVREKAID